MKKCKRRWNQKGFTLIESIIALVLVSVMAAMLFTLSQPHLNAFGWFHDELLLQQSMERILGDYKNQRNDPNNPFDPSLFKQYIINKYPTEVDVSRTGFLTFNGAGSTYTAIWPPQANMPAGSPPVLIITVQRNEIFLSMIFT